MTNKKEQCQNPLCKSTKDLTDHHLLDDKGNRIAGVLRICKQCHRTYNWIRQIEKNHGGQLRWCILCGASDESETLLQFYDKYICTDCLHEVKSSRIVLLGEGKGEHSD